jgi:hypothetical protein
MISVIEGSIESGSNLSGNHVVEITIKFKELYKYKIIMQNLYNIGSIAWNYIKSYSGS